MKNTCVHNFLGKHVVVAQSDNGAGGQMYFYLRDATQEDMATLPHNDNLVLI